MAAEILVDPGVSETDSLDSVMTPAVSVDSDITGTDLTLARIASAVSVNLGVSGTDMTGLMKTRAGLTRKKE